MITHLRGKLIEKKPTHLVVDCQGVGYFVHISLFTYEQIPEKEDITILTYLSIKEDAHTLYGFVSNLERELFKLLISVSGVGTSTARTMLSSLSPVELKQAIASENVNTIQSVKGIGAKTAQRLILDLKDKIVKLYGIEASAIEESNTVQNEALSALEVLGYLRKQAEKTVQFVLKENPTISVENLIKEALKRL